MAELILHKTFQVHGKPRINNRERLLQLPSPGSVFAEGMYSIGILVNLLWNSLFKHVLHLCHKFPVEDEPQTKHGKDFEDFDTPNGLGSSGRIEIAKSRYFLDQMVRYTRQ